jgi:hypothetical protein
VPAAVGVLRILSRIADRRDAEPMVLAVRDGARDVEGNELDGAPDRRRHQGQRGLGDMSPASELLMVVSELGDEERAVMLYGANRNRTARGSVAGLAQFSCM